MKKDGHYGFLGRDLNLQIPLRYSEARPFSSGSSVTVVKENGSRVIINRNGQTVRAAAFENASQCLKQAVGSVLILALLLRAPYSLPCGAAIDFSSEVSLAFMNSRAAACFKRSVSLPPA